MLGQYEEAKKQMELELLEVDGVDEDVKTAVVTIVFEQIFPILLKALQELLSKRKEDAS